MPHSARPFFHALASCLLTACAARQAPKGTLPASPEVYIEQQLISQRKGEINTVTSDGGMLYHADFDASRPNALRVPFDLLKAHCETHGGQWQPSDKPRVSAANLAAGKAPAAVAASLSNADAEGVFGKYRCVSGGPVWTASIEPSAFTPTDRSETWRLQLFIKAFVGSDLSSSDGLPLPPPSAANAVVSTPPATAAAPSSVPPLDRQPPRPPAETDKRLANPRPFGINMGGDAPDLFATKLRLSTPSACAKASAKPDKPTKAKAAAAAVSGAPTELCWDHPAGGEALALRASFADLGAGPVIGEFELRYPAPAFAWLEHQMHNDWGPADGSSDRSARSWSWLHTTVELSHLDNDESHETLVRVRHKPTLDRAQLPVGAAGREQPSPTRMASPWQLQLGYEPAQVAQAKLQAVGFYIVSGSCSDGGLHAMPLLTRSCQLQGGKMDGLRSASVEIVDPGDGRPRLAQLAYIFDKKVYDETIAELKTQYGEPVTEATGDLEWWTGPVGIRVSSRLDAANPNAFSLRYFHGRLMQYSQNAAEKNRAGDKALQRQGL